MTPLLATALLSLLSSRGERLWIDCRIEGDPAVELRRRVRLYPGRHDHLFAVHGKMFLALRYNAPDEIVAVTVVEAQHAPWTFGEKVVVPERTFSVAPGATGRVALDAVAPGATLQCGGP